MNIGLTGGIACGKSTVSDMLVRRGADLVDADRIARDVVLPGSPVLQAVAERFGPDILQADGTLHRKKLGEIVFRNPEAKRDLEALMHPAIRQRMREQMHRFETERPSRLVVVDVPLLYESGLESMFREVLVVYVPKSVQLRRLMERDGLDREHAEARIRSQMPIEEKRRRADIVIDNSGTLADTEAQVEAFWLAKGRS